MKKNQKLGFTKKPSRPVLTKEEAVYWTNLFRKICKVGLEFEFNLPENEGTCSGDSLTCPCSNPKKITEECYAECKSFPACELRKQGIKCPGIYCVEFVSPCPTCKEAIIDCKLCKFYMDPNKRPKNKRMSIEKDLAPTKDVSKIGKHGVLSITTDGSLTGDSGIEIPTVGRRVDFSTMREQCQLIIDRCTKEGAFVNERTSSHIHLMTGYYNLSNTGNGPVVVYNKRENSGQIRIDEMEKPMPEIILANFHQLIRRYHNALVWITSSGGDKAKITRWCKFRKSILKYSAMRNPMYRVIEELRENDEHRGRYSSINYTNIIFDNNGDILRFHIENRFSDGMMSPSAIAAFGVLTYAMLILATRLSQYGIMHSGDSQYMKEARRIEECFMNNDGSYSGPRFSNTENFWPYQEVVRNQATELISRLRAELRRQPGSEAVLMALAEKPCSLRICDGDTWDKIEKDICPESYEMNRVHSKIISAVDTSLIELCEDRREWTAVFAEENKMSEKAALAAVKYLEDKKVIHWEQDCGTYLR